CIGGVSWSGGGGVLTPGWVLSPGAGVAVPDGLVPVGLVSGGIVPVGGVMPGAAGGVLVPGEGGGADGLAVLPGAPWLGSGTAAGGGLGGRVSDGRGLGGGRGGARHQQVAAVLGGVERGHGAEQARRRDPRPGLALVGVDVEHQERIGLLVVGGQRRDVTAALLAQRGAEVVHHHVVTRAAEVVDQLAAGDLVWGAL